MGAIVLSIITGPILLAIGLFLLFGKKRFDRRRNLEECRIEFYVAKQDVQTAQSMLAHANETTWMELCLRLARCGRNPALQYLTQVTNEAQAEDMFMTAKAKLDRVFETATMNLELAQSFFPADES